MSDQSFDFNAFVAESKQTLLNPADYFSTMKTEGGFSEPLIKTIIYGAVAGIFGFLWSILHIGGAVGGVFGGAIGIMAFVWGIIGALIALIIGAIIVLILSAIAGGNTDFEANIRVTAALLVLMPVSSFLGFFSGINLTLGLIVTLIVNLYGVYLIYHALTKTLKGKEGTSKVLSFILAAIAIIFLITALSTRHISERYMDRLESQNEQMIEQMQSTMDKAAEEIDNN